MGRQIYFAPIDLVEDRARTRVVGVAVMTAVYKPRPKTGSRRMLVLLVLPRGITPTPTPTPHPTLATRVGVGRTVGVAPREAVPLLVT